MGVFVTTLLAKSKFSVYVIYILNQTMCKFVCQENYCYVSLIVFIRAKGEATHKYVQFLGVQFIQKVIRALDLTFSLGLS